MLKLSLFFSPFQSELTIPDQIHFLKVQNCHLVSLIVLVPQWMLKWSKRVSLRSVSSTNYPTSHHPQLSIFFFFFFTRLQILCIAKHYDIQRIQNQIHTTFTHLSFLAYKTQKWSKIHEDNSTSISFYVCLDFFFGFHWFILTPKFQKQLINE